ncbi:MAG: hypothetical protein ACOX1R_06165 [Caldicoprobacterales bacterium]|jgi:hypothetical protein|nr:hypothetical protein [Clostridiales bacterium]
MKRFFILSMVLLLLLAACSKGGNTSGDAAGDMPVDGTKGNSQDIQEGQNPADSQENQEVDQEKGYEFVFNGVTIAMHSKMEPILEKLGEPMEYFEAESCALPGMEKIYTYSGFEILTYEKEGVDYVLSVVILDDSVSTKEGIYLYSDLDSLIEKYGDDYTKELNTYKYESGQSQLVFLVEDDEITSIEYLATMEQ